MSLRLHGVVRARHRWPDGSPFRLIVVDDLAVVVSDHHSELTEQDATANLAGLCALLLAGPVLPLRIGTVAVDEEAARAAVLALTVPALRAHLERLDGLAEMHVRLAFDEETALRAVFDEGAFTGGGRDLASTIGRGEQIAQAVAAWRGKQADALLAPVSALSRSVAMLDAREHTEDLRAFLVPLDQAEAVRTAVAGFDGVVATCTGPLPAFHFLDLAPQPVSRWGW
ncbi:GvpL/GvpF family gas vesicle protein [Lentzea sp. NPDC005914]|uniref:GvpL/GvpF family gas vesicle protein n=1 Tax=Lentzea sp. NPDC005914 TaxID=3154572 RepID=UPI00340FA451